MLWKKDAVFLGVGLALILVAMIAVGGAYEWASQETLPGGNVRGIVSPVEYQARSSIWMFRCCVAACVGLLFLATGCAILVVRATKADGR